MTVSLIPGHSDWRAEQDEVGHRTYTITHKVFADPEDGPFEVMNCPGLPEKGSRWNFDNDVDGDAFCTWDKKATPIVTGEKNTVWLVESKYTTRAVNECRDEAQTDPLEEPNKVTVSVTKFTEEGVSDIFGLPIKNSAHEQIRGPQNEWDASRTVIRITQNVALMELDVLDKYIDRVNESEIWGMQERHIKFSNYNVTEKFQGDCEVYYERMLEFEVRREGFDRYLLDEGTKVLHGTWDPTLDQWNLIDINGFAPNPLNPAHFDRAFDRQGNPTRLLLDGAGQPFFRNAAETESWWCVNNGVDSFAEFNTCSGIQETARYAGALVSGPYTTEVDAEVACDDPEFGDMTSPADLICVGDTKNPARIGVKKYLSGDLLTKLHLPDTIGP